MDEKPIEVENLTVQFGEFKALHDVSFQIEERELAVIIGPNGAGKTTLIKAILGLVPYKGTIKIFGKDLSELTLEEKQKISYVPQRFENYQNVPITTREFLNLFLPQRFDRKKAKETLERYAEVGNITNLLDKQVSKLSDGELQRVLIVRALASEPKIILFDEPFSGVDKIGERAFFDFIQFLKENYGLTIMLVSHDVFNVTNLADKVVCLNHRLVCFGNPEDVLIEEHFEEIFGANVSMNKHKICEDGGPCKFYEDDNTTHH